MGRSSESSGVLSISTSRSFVKSDLGMITVESDRLDVQTAIKVQKFGSVTI